VIKIILAAIMISIGCIAACNAQVSYSENPFVFRLQQPVPEIYGGIFVHDLNGDGTFDFVVTSENYIGAYSHNGELLWLKEIDIKLWDSTHHPSAIAGDMDGDGQQEVAFLISDQITIVDGATGNAEKTLPAGEAIAMAIANLRGLGDRDVVLQYSQTELKAIKLDDGSQLWETDEYRGIEHSPLRQADLDGDGLDEIAGASIIDHDGKKMNDWDLGGVYKSIDSIAIGDVVPGYPLEVALAEQRGANSHTDVVNPDRIVFRSLNPWNWEDPDKVTIGNFDPSKAGLEIFNRSSGGDGTCPRGNEEPYASEEGPWVLDSAGNLLNKYYINDSKPDWWTGHGIEEISKIDWDGDDVDEIAAKERHKNGAWAIINPMTGQFLEIFREKVVRLYVVDIQGDYREEVVILDEDGSVKVFWNGEDNPYPQKPRYWTQNHYKRQKQNWNYYSP